MDTDDRLGFRGGPLKRYCLTLDLKNDAALIEEYKRYHQNVWPEIRDSILSTGISAMEIYLLGNRLCMVIDADDTFSFESKSRADAANPAVQRWEALMWRYQEPLAETKPGEKWLVMENIFCLRAGD